MADQDGDKTFKVVDRRSHEADGTEKPEEEDAGTAGPPGEQPDAPRDEPLFQFDFITFLLSLHHSAACHLGATPEPETRTCKENLPLAKQTIDILGMLQEKTQGNLSGEEERILSEILYDLRVAYVKAASKKL
jgi:hypothetical protein